MTISVGSVRQHDTARWQRSGITDPAGNLLGRDAALGKLRIPAVVRIDGEDLVWRWDDHLKDGALAGRSYADAPRDLLDRFLALPGQGAKGVERFAKALGPLCITQDFRLAESGYHAKQGHGRAGQPIRIARPLGPLDAPRNNGREPLRLWDEWAGRARALVNLSVSLQHAEPGSHREQAWSTVASGAPEPDWPTDETERRHRECQEVARLVSHWMLVANVRPWVGWDTDPPSFYLDPSGSLFGALGIRLAHVVGMSRGLAICSNCGRPYQRRRSPKPGLRNYCDDRVCQSAKLADAARDYRARRAKDREVPRP